MIEKILRFVKRLTWEQVLWYCLLIAVWLTVSNLISGGIESCRRKRADRQIEKHQQDANQSLSKADDARNQSVQLEAAANLAEKQLERKNEQLDETQKTADNAVSNVNAVRNRTYADSSGANVARKLDELYP